MPRFFIEVAYKGGSYAGFQVQQNANTIQAEVEKALNTYFRFKSDDPSKENDEILQITHEDVTPPPPPVERAGVRESESADRESKQPNPVTHEGVTPPSPLVEREGVRVTGSSRTDTGVHARQNFFHFDTEKVISPEKANKGVYHLNAILPRDIVVLSLRQVRDNAHCRFDALTRTYQYTVHTLKDPFIADTAYFYPYTLNVNALHETAAMIKAYTDFTSFSKKNSQVQSFDCRIDRSEWEVGEDRLVYTVTGNRFLRGMVRGLVGTMLQVGRGKLSKDSFRELIEKKNAARTDFSAPGKGLVLMSVAYPADIFKM